MYAHLRCCWHGDPNTRDHTIALLPLVVLSLRASSRIHLSLFFFAALLSLPPRTSASSFVLLVKFASAQAPINPTARSSQRAVTMQRAINDFIDRRSHAWIAATPATRFLSLSTGADNRALLIYDHVRLSVVHHTQPPFLRVVVEQLDDEVTGAQRYLDAFQWYIAKMVGNVSTCPMDLVSRCFFGHIVTLPGVMYKLDLGGEGNFPVHLADYQERLPDLVMLDLSYYLSLDRDVTDLHLLRTCEKLRHVGLSGTNVVEVSWMNMQVVEHLDVRWCDDFTQLDALEKGCALKELLCTMTPLENLGPLRGCTHLQVLDLTECESLVDFEPLAALKGTLTRLNVSATAFSNLNVLRDFYSLEYLNMDGCGVSDLSPLTGLFNLKELDMDSTQVASIDALATCTSLEVLSARRCRQLSSVAALAHHGALTRLVVGETAVSDVSPLRSCPRLASLDVRSCKDITTAAEFGEWPALSRLYLEYTSVQWSDSLAAALRGIQFVDLRDRPRCQH